MDFIADFHIHSHFSLATSKELCPEQLDYYARLKGIQVVGTGDCTHPGWLDELRAKLEPAGEGLYRLRKSFRKDLPFPAETEVRFMLTTEISNIYKKDGAVRKVHNVMFFPSFGIAEKLQKRLMELGFNITSDGRPILGLDSRDLLELCLECSPDIFFVPAHIWTPWFSVLGSKSGFDSVEACFEDLSDHIHAVETGLSTDPPMNWCCSILDRYTLIANSDAHSPDKLGRNANMLSTGLSYPEIIHAIKSGDPQQFLGTIDFFPEEGKYHYDGHRKCGICWDPLETLKHDGICPVCGSQVTVGVLNRMAQLADRDDVTQRPGRHAFHSLIPLKEIIAGMEKSGPASRKVEQIYMQWVRRAGSEINLLLRLEPDQLRRIGGEVLAEAIRRMRNREVFIREGFDGQYGVISVFDNQQKAAPATPGGLFSEQVAAYGSAIRPRPLISFDLKAYRQLFSQRKPAAAACDHPEPASVVSDLFSQGDGLLSGLNDDQHAAVLHPGGPALVLAGPGTGKTRIITSRIAWLIGNRGIPPSAVLAITFTNKAAGEMRERINGLFPGRNILDELQVSTFHSFGLSVLREHDGSRHLHILDERGKARLLRSLDMTLKEIRKTARMISDVKSGIREAGEEAAVMKRYKEALRQRNAVDFDDLITLPADMLVRDAMLLARIRQRYRFILVDEYQDVNPAQYRLLRMLMPGSGADLMVVGDPDQAIYGFRGADSRYIGQFGRDYPGSTVYMLRKSYRCPDTILTASSSMLHEGDGGIRSLEGLPEGVKVRMASFSSDKSEASFIARTIERMIGGTSFHSMDRSISAGEGSPGVTGFADFAILCRTSRMMHAYRDALSQRNIPYQEIGEEPFYIQEPYAGILDVLKMASGPLDMLPGSPESGHEPDLSRIRKVLEPGGTVKDIILRTARAFHPGKITEMQDDLERLAGLAEPFGDNIHSFLDHLSLGSAADTFREKSETVALMTIHASKGLEFPCVFIPGVEEGVIPWSLMGKDDADVQEERRLLYVGMTRAGRYLFLSSARKRFMMGRHFNLPHSHFLDAIAEGLIEREARAARKSSGEKNRQPSLFDPE